MFTTKFKNIPELKTDLFHHGLVVLKDMELTDQDLLNLAANLSERGGRLQDKVLHWEFGPIMEMRHQWDAQNYLFSGESVPFHWDGAFYREPSFLLFYCTESSGPGGETLFVNTTSLWNSLSSSEKHEARNIRLTYKTEKKAHYGGSIQVPLVQDHPRHRTQILRMAEKVETTLNPVTLEIEGIQNPHEFYETMVNRLYDPKYASEHSWKKGDLLLCDNFTFLHGRRSLGENLSRSFKRLQIL